MTIGIQKFDSIWPAKGSGESILSIVLWGVCGDYIEISMILIQKFYLGHPVIGDTQLNDTPLWWRHVVRTATLQHQVELIIDKIY